MKRSIFSLILAVVVTGSLVSVPATSRAAVSEAWIDTINDWVVSGWAYAPETSVGLTLNFRSVSDPAQVLKFESHNHTQYFNYYPRADVRSYLNGKGEQIPENANLGFSFNIQQSVPDGSYRLESAFYGNTPIPLTLNAKRQYPILQKPYVTEGEGWIDGISADGKISGWGYFNDETMSFAVTLEDVNDPSRKYTFDSISARIHGVSSFRIYSRSDVNTYLNSQYGIPTPVAPTSFTIDTANRLPNGTYRIAGGIFGIEWQYTFYTNDDNGNIVGRFGLTGNSAATYTVTNSPVQLGSEAWIDSAECCVIKGWAYDQNKPLDIEIVVARIDVAQDSAGTTRTYRLRSVPAQTNQYVFGYRGDVAQYLLNRHQAYTVYPNPGFMLSLGDLPNGTWHVRSALFNGKNVTIPGYAAQPFTVNR